MDLFRLKYRFYTLDFYTNWLKNRLSPVYWSSQEISIINHY
jgi:hypothetical protein